MSVRAESAAKVSVLRAQKLIDERPLTGHNGCTESGAGPTPLQEEPEGTESEHDTACYNILDIVAEHAGIVAAAAAVERCDGDARPVSLLSPAVDVARDRNCARAQLKSSRARRNLPSVPARETSPASRP